MDDPQTPTTPRPRSRHIYLLPNLLTTANMFAGFYAILAAANGSFEAACIAVIVAGIFDGLDGRVARLTGTTSEFGVQYDSLSDLLSFGIAPALVMYHWGLAQLALDGGVWGKVGWAAAFLYVACAALRLARFNVSAGSTDKRWFIGLASPASAGTMISVVWLFSSLGYSGDELRWVALFATVTCALLMVSRVRFFAFRGWPGERVPFWFMVVVVAVLVALMIDTPKVIFAVAVVYVLSGPVGWLVQRIRPKAAAT
ncbi:MAG TPA: CDP-diacylglycerol--serine O-phosphatidyltransferase [Xanthomonadaceae bacterium]|jgi:CDP-diacylglycerol--serine O-phosphatidyltransferase|nr:CDP-diacylglycerol--serine O-phosphatidyltransferase [Xanthomonadaceae bacterium]